MKNFSGNLKTEQLGRWEHRLLEDLVYTDDEVGSIIVPQGYVTDFASVRSLRIWLNPLYATLVGYGNASAAVHDVLYETQIFSRRVADDIFFRALRDEGTALWRAYIFYWGIRLTGWKVFNDYKKKKGLK